jgi:hypothetical protein
MVVASAALWVGTHPARVADGPSPEQKKDIDLLVHRCADIPLDQVDVCTMREYQKLHP